MTENFSKTIVRKSNLCEEAKPKKLNFESCIDVANLELNWFVFL